MKMGIYPSRLEWEHKAVAEVNRRFGEIAVRGRLLDLDKGQGRIMDESGEVDFSCENVPTGIKAGDFVEVNGAVGEEGFTVNQMRLLASANGEWSGGDWARFNGTGKRLRQNLYLRARILDAVHRFFNQQHFLAVETPVLGRASAQEEHIRLFSTQYRAEGTKEEEPFYLAPSPELYMKRMLGAGLERIFQISRSFRNGETGAFHNPEFTLIEWYRAYASYEEIMADVENLVAFVAEQVLGKSAIVRAGKEIDLRPPWERITVHRAFARWANIDLGVCATRVDLIRRARELGYGSARPEDSWEDLFHKILLERVEPQLAEIGAVHLVDYPRQLAALARMKEGQPAIAERTEAYIGGVELSNGYTELNDPIEQRRRFMAGARSGFTGEDPPLDQVFLAAMERGFPPAGGVALGMDRLIMLIAGAAKLDQVIAFPL